MKSLSEYANDYLFAPAQYLHKNGNIVGAGRLKNFLSQPDNKIAALCAISIAFGAAAMGYQDLKSATLGVTGGIVAVSAIRRRQKNGIEYYFDTAPIHKRPIPAHIHHTLQTDLFLNRNVMPFVTVASAGIAGGIIYGLTQNANTTLVATAVTSIGSFTDAFAHCWRIKQALNGNWNVLTQQPEIKEAEAEYSSSLTPAPIYNKS